MYAMLDSPCLSAKLAAYNRKIDGEVSWKLSASETSVSIGYLVVRSIDYMLDDER